MTDEGTILVVEDTHASLKLLMEILTGAGYHVRPADSGEIALASVAAGPPELILLDILMPGMDGFEILRRLKMRKETCDIPVIILSAITEAAQRIEALKLGAVDFITKPFQSDELLARVRTHMDLFRLHVRLEDQSADLRRANEQLLIKVEECRRSDASIRALALRQEALLSAIPDIVMEVDTNKVYTWANQAGIEFFGDDAIGKDASFYFEGEQEIYKTVAPLFNGDENVIYVESWQRRRDGQKRLLAWWCRVLKGEGGQIIGALSSARDITASKQVEEELRRTLETLRKAVNTTIQVMVSAVETRDPYTASHQIRSADLSRAIAAEMGLPKEIIESIRMAGSIHDIGKLSIPAEILSKPTKLSEIEFSLIKEHARQGYELLKNVESPWPLAEMIYQHHERMDGSGYPRHLKGDDIIMEARILAVSDVVESMSSHRPYRPALGIDAAMEEIEKKRGTLYDPVVADACLRLFRNNGFQFGPPGIAERPGLN